MNKKNKKAWLRILESVIGVLIILLALIFFVSQQTKITSKEEKVREILSVLLDEIEKNQTLRNAIVTNDNDTLNQYISSQIQKLYPFYNFTFCITDPYRTCSWFYPSEKLPQKKEIFSDSVLISYEDGGKVKSKKFILYIWEK